MIIQTWLRKLHLCEYSLGYTEMIIQTWLHKCHLCEYIVNCTNMYMYLPKQDPSCTRHFANKDAYSDDCGSIPSVSSQYAGRISWCPNLGRLGMLKTPSCPWLGCKVAGLNLETCLNLESCPYIAELLVNMTLKWHLEQIFIKKKMYLWNTMPPVAKKWRTVLSVKVNVKVTRSLTL